MIPWLGPGRTGYSLRGGCRIARLGLGSMEGVTAIAATSAQAYRAVQLAGASYLLLLGIRNWRVTGAALPDTAAGLAAGRKAVPTAAVIVPSR